MADDVFTEALSGKGVVPKPLKENRKTGKCRLAYVRYVYRRYRAVVIEINANFQSRRYS